jgi:hypothetical protein
VSFLLARHADVPRNAFFFAVIPAKAEIHFDFAAKARTGFQSSPE